MRTWGYTPSSEELAAVKDATTAFRQTWASIRPPWPAPFDGTITDVRAIDYMQYEGIQFPPCGIEGAALICGEVVRRVASLEWIIAYTGQWFIATEEDDWPGIVICPVSRVYELEFSGTPQFGRYGLFAARAAMDCLPYARPEAQGALRALIDLVEGCVEGSER
ncbi:MAG: hypothetical protein JWN40_125 [Phycisphaerales bacterium]|nr:hypothetical protein [Phycisphaerales bacterium]